MPDQAESLRQLLREEHPTVSKRSGNMRLIAVASGKGGVGKSNISLNLGLMLAKEGMRIAILDGDFGFANIDILLGVRPHYSLLDVLEGHISLQQALTRGPHDLAFISGGAKLITDMQAHSLYGAKLTEELLLIEDQFDRVYIDFGAGFGPFTAELMGLCDELLLITTPEPTALADAYALLKMVKNTITLPPVFLLINRAVNVVAGMDAGRKLSRVAEQFLQTQIEVIGYVLEDPAVQRAVSKQTPFVLLEPHSLATRCLMQITKNVREDSFRPIAPELEKTRGLQGFLNRFLPFRR